MDRKLKKDCLDLPPKNYQRIMVDMTREQARIHQDFKKTMYAEIRGEAVSVNYMLTKMMKLNQITSGFYYKEEIIDNKIIKIPLEISHNKLNELKNIIDNNEKVVVWAIFKHDFKQIKKAFPETNPLAISGDETSEEKQYNKNIFHTDPSHRLLIIHPKAGGVGITITAANMVVYYSYDYSYINRSQSEDRTHRIGTIGTVTYVDLVCRSSIDETISKCVSNKRKTAENIIDMTGDEDFKETVIQEFFNEFEGAL